MTAAKIMRMRSGAVFRRLWISLWARFRAQELDVCYYKALAQYKSGDAKAATGRVIVGLVDYDKQRTGKFTI